MSADKQDFQYEPLGQSGFPIRVLQVLPGEDCDPIACKLGTYKEADGSGWTCLSYTWGSDTASEEITINGLTFRVRPNIYDFLREARRRRLANLWIDSICINQSDVDERNAQVKLMSTIFGDAKLVVLWLGQSSPSLESAINRLESAFAPDTSRISVAVGKPVFCQMSHAECTSLFDACLNAVWTRRWIKQEVVLPLTCILCCGSASISISVFLAAIEALVHYDTMHAHSQPTAVAQDLSQNGISGQSQRERGVCPYNSCNLDERERQCTNVLALTSFRGLERRKIHLPWLLETFKYSACTNFHDCVYAFRALMQEGHLLRVDYGLSTAALFTETLDFIARTSHPRLPGSAAAERNLLSNIYRGLLMTDQDLQGIFSSRHTVFLVQVGYSLEMLRKDVSVWVFAKSITDAAALAASSWRNEELQGQCRYIVDGGVMHGGQVALNQLAQQPDMDERDIWMYGLQADREPNLDCLRALYEPRWLYGCDPETSTLLNSAVENDHAVMAMAFEPGKDQVKLEQWLNEVRHQFVVTITDRDDAGRQIQVSVLPGCDSEACLLRPWNY